MSAPTAPSTETKTSDITSDNRAHGIFAQVPPKLSHQAFEENAIKTPTLIAVEQGDVSLTYAELDLLASQLAHELIIKGIKVGDFVGLITDRSVEMIVGILGILKAGAAYVPIDATLPFDRIRYILETAKCSTIVLNPLVPTSLVDQLPEVQIVMADMTMLSNVQPVQPFPFPGLDAPAYAVFTSGSTGKPKGVVVTHRGLTSKCSIEPNCYLVSNGDRVAQFLSIGFDMCIGTIFCALSIGATLVLREDHNPMGLMDKITHLIITPTGLSKIDPQDYPLIRTVVVGGEAVSDALVKVWAPHVRMYNSYGPAEITLTCNYKLLEVGTPITVGIPMPNTIQYIVDSDLNLVTDGESGELVIGGLGVSLGYLNRPELTAEKFIDNHFEMDGSKMYRSGDICRWAEDGEIQFLGRTDDMVKVKGYRIELEEVANAVATNEQVSTAAVIYRNDMLVAFVTPTNVDLESIRRSVSSLLPNYMAPARYVPLDIMPINANGKIDKLALKVMDLTSMLEIPETDAEIKLAQIWSELLFVQTDQIGKETSFFELGGDSISAIKLAQLCREVGIYLTTALIFSHSTLSMMAGLQESQSESDLLELPPKYLKIINFSYEIIKEINENYCPTLSLDDGFDAYPATSLQSVICIATFANRSAYTNQVVLEINGQVESDTLTSALSKTLLGHSILRSRFVPTSDGIYIIEQPNADISVEEGSDLEEYCLSSIEKGFTAEDPFWIRLALIQAPSRPFSHMVLTIHHALFDGWCIPQIIETILAHYGEGNPTSTSNFKNVVRYVNSQDINESKCFWATYLGGIEPATPFIPPSILAKEDPTQIVMESSRSWSQLSSAAKNRNLTVAVLAKAAWAFTNSLYTGNEDIVFGNVLSGRDIPIHGVES